MNLQLLQKPDLSPLRFSGATVGSCAGGDGLRIRSSTTG